MFLNIFYLLAYLVYILIKIQVNYIEPTPKSNRYSFTRDNERIHQPPGRDSKPKSCSLERVKIPQDISHAILFSYPRQLKSNKKKEYSRYKSNISFIWNEKKHKGWRNCVKNWLKKRLKVLYICHGNCSVRNNKMETTLYSSHQRYCKRQVWSLQKICCCY